MLLSYTASAISVKKFNRIMHLTGRLIEFSMLLHSPAPKTGTRPDHSFNECLERHIRTISCRMEYIQQDFDQNAQPIVLRLSRWNQSKVHSDFDDEETYDIYGCPNSHWPAWQGFRAQIQSMHVHYS